MAIDQIDTITAHDYRWIAGHRHHGGHCIAHVECAVSTIHHSGDHSIVVGDAVSGAADGGDPLVSFTRSFRELAPCS